MATEDPVAVPYAIPFEAFGVRVLVSASDEMARDAIAAILPPGAVECDPEIAEPHYALMREVAGTYSLLRDGQSVHQGVELDLVVGLLDGQLRYEVSRRATETVFIHAGVVGHEGRAILLPGVSFAGKTNLTAALVRAGADYYSDEFALLDEDGLVHPYARDLSLRVNGQMADSDTPVERLGGEQAVNPIPLGLVVFTEYRPGAVWDPKTLALGEAALELLPHAMAARQRPEATLHAIAAALGHTPKVLKSQRGEADDLAPLLLAELGSGPR